MIFLELYKLRRAEQNQKSKNINMLKQANANKLQSILKYRVGTLYCEHPKKNSVLGAVEQ